MTIKKIKSWISKSWMFIIFFISFFIFWEYAVILFDIPLFILPPPSLIVEKGWVDIDRLIYYTGITASETVIGYVIAIVLGLFFGVAISFSQILRRTIYPFFVSIEMTPLL